MKNYYDAHETAYKQIKAQGLLSWDRAKSIDDLCNDTTKNFLISVLPQYFKSPENMKALDLGCGTGTTAFVFSKLGFDVTGIDISETAIEMAKDLAVQQNLSTSFKKWDVLQLEGLNQKFDLIYDSHCLHCIVFDEDRARVLEGIKNSLSDDGIFILDTATFAEEKGSNLGFADGLRFDENYILWHKTGNSDYRGVVEIDGQKWCAQRRFYPADKIEAEILQAGFEILSEVDMETTRDSVHGMIRLICKK